jgi:orotidine-5'-phosphate decarboxylase
MAKLPSFRERIDNSSKYKNSQIVLSLDPFPRSDLIGFVKAIITLLERHICAIKINFHLILPLSISQISEINNLIHYYELQSIADIKLNDISSTNEIAIGYLLKMGFDAVIVNPLRGKNALQFAVDQAHEMNAGIIALIYMSHPEAKEGFGINVIKQAKDNNNNKVTSMYKVFLDYAYTSQVDGIVVGATQIDILKEISSQKKAPIYSPGFGTQGGDIKQAAKSGTDYFIIGSSIIGSRDPLTVVKEIQRQTYRI